MCSFYLEDKKIRVITLQKSMVQIFAALHYFLSIILYVSYVDLHISLQGLHLSFSEIDSLTAIVKVPRR